MFSGAHRFCSVACYRRFKGETRLEAAVRIVLTEATIPFEQEAKVGRWAVDFLVAGRIVLEADGDYWHQRPGVRERDSRRDAKLARLGYTVVRLSEADVMARPATVLTALRRCGLTRARGSWRTRSLQLSLALTAS